VEEYMKSKSKESPEDVRQKLKPGDVRVVNINGRPTTLVIGREYVFELKSGCMPQPYKPEQTKEAEGEPKRKMPKTNVKIAKRKLSTEPKLAAAKSLMSAVDVAEAAAIERGHPLTDEELKQLGYVETEGGTWELPIPIEICKLLVAEDQKKNA
jgi:hypothetical protein